jgi:hypothetical protein
LTGNVISTIMQSETTAHMMTLRALRIDVPSKLLNRGTNWRPRACMLYLRQAAVMAASPMQSGEGTVTPIALTDCSIGAAAASGLALVCGASPGSGTRGPMGAGNDATP